MRDAVGEVDVEPEQTNFDAARHAKIDLAHMGLLQSLATPVVFDRRCESEAVPCREKGREKGGREKGTLFFLAFLLPSLDLRFRGWFRESPLGSFPQVAVVLGSKNRSRIQFGELVLPQMVLLSGMAAE